MVSLEDLERLFSLDGISMTTERGCRRAASRTKMKVETIFVEVLTLSGKHQSLSLDVTEEKLTNLQPDMTRNEMLMRIRNDRPSRKVTGKPALNSKGC